MMLYGTGRAGEALPHLRYGVERGLNTSLLYSYLASAESEAGDGRLAEQTLARAVNVYPRSVFLRVRHATALAEAGMMNDARKEYAAALILDERVARGWWYLINRGFDEAKRAAHEDSGIAFAGELYPENCIVPTISLNKRRPPVAFPEDSKLLQAAADRACAPQ
jgi:predicted Zn-dependent protease